MPSASTAGYCALCDEWWPCPSWREGHDASSDSNETRVTSSTGGQKGTKPQRMDLLPPEALMAVSEVYGFGASKYADHNYRKGYAWSLSYAALQRHMHQFWAGEDLDPESGLPHVGHAAFHALTLLTFMSEHREFDDRYTTTTKEKQ
jgi:hypothetical protein